MRHLQAKTFAVVLALLLSGFALSGCQSSGGDDFRYLEKTSYGP